MTAEIAVMNTLGVALAADSAVTIGSDAKKIYSSADKLFQLTKHAPVAVMIYDGAEFLGIPWETIVKEYGKHLNSTTFDELSEYATGFFEFIETNKEILKYVLQGESDATETGIVFAGFGGCEYMPVLLEYKITGIANGKILFQGAPAKKISPDSFTAAIVPFAQQEMVLTFLKGIHPDYEEHIKETTTVLFNKVLTETLSDKNLSDEQIRSLIPDTTIIIKSLFADWEGKGRDHWNPIVEMVEFLPKDELASMAEMLVNLTKFHRRISPESETVGGPIDVALITKGDGFVWVKRKNYYPAEYQLAYNPYNPLNQTR